MDYRRFKELNNDIISIRKTVFEKEQGFQNEFDEVDQNCSHIVLYDRAVKEQPVQEYLTDSSGILGQINLETLNNVYAIAPNILKANVMHIIINPELSVKQKILNINESFQ